MVSMKLMAQREEQFQDFLERGFPGHSVEYFPNLVVKLGEVVPYFRINNLGTGKKSAIIPCFAHKRGQAERVVKLREDLFAQGMGRAPVVLYRSEGASEEDFFRIWYEKLKHKKENNKGLKYYSISQLKLTIKSHPEEMLGLAGKINTGLAFEESGKVRIEQYFHPEEDLLKSFLFRSMASDYSHRFMPEHVPEVREFETIVRWDKKGILFTRGPFDIDSERGHVIHTEEVGEGVKLNFDSGMHYVYNSDVLNVLMKGHVPTSRLISPPSGRSPRIRLLEAPKYH